MSKYNVYVEDVSVEAVFNKLNGVDGARRFLAGQTVVSPVGGNILTIDRSVRPVYPDFAKVVMHPELEDVGPTSFDLVTLPLYPHPTQKKGGRIEGNKLYSSLKDTGLIEYCLDLRVGEELVKQPHLWPASWKGLFLPLWKSVVRYADGNLYVPYVYEHAGRVFVNWNLLDNDFYDNYPAALSAS